MTDPDSKRRIYLIEDQFFRFWYTFVPKNISAIQSGRMEKSWQWWGKNPKTHRQAQIDIVVTSAEDDSGIVGSCKFREGLVGKEELQLMEEYADAMGHLGKRYYYLFSKSGFAAPLMECAKNEKLRLITLKDIY